MDNKPKISIIIPVHNVADTIERCVESFQNEHYERLELILIENNSKDMSLQVCGKLADKYSNIKLISTQKTGVSAARNIGLDNADGEIIGFADGDDFISPGYLSYVSEVFSSEDPDVVVTGFNRCLLNGQHLRSESLAETTSVSLYELSQMCLYEAAIMGAVWNKCFKRKILSGTYFDIELSHCEDMHFIISSMMKHKNKRAVISDKCFYNYIQNPQSTVMDKSKLFDLDGYLKYNKAFDKIIAEQDDKLIKDLALRKKCLIESDILLDEIDSEYKKKAFKDIISNTLNLIKTQFFIFPKGIRDSIILLKRIIKY